MRSLVFDELTAREMEAVKGYLAARLEFSGVEGLYWLELPRELWADRQRRGLSESYRLAVEAGPDWARFELLVRAETLANPGIGQATAEQALFVLKWADAMARELGLVTCAGLEEKGGSS